MRKAAFLLLVFFPLSLPFYALWRRAAGKKNPGRSRRRLRRVKRLVEGEVENTCRWEQTYIW
jgi:hypothetical protein